MTSQPQTQMQTTKQTLTAPAPWTCSLTRKADRGADGLRKVAAAPAPWTLKVKQSFAMLFSADLAKPQALHQHLTSNYDVSDFLNTGAGAVLLVRYEDSPAGPYDELLLIPGAFRQRPSPPGDDGRPTPPPAVASMSAKSGSQTGPTPSAVRKGDMLADRRVSRIYVSTEESVRNGRANWGIRKELADFEWTETPGYLSSKTHVVVRDRLSGNVMLDATFSTANTLTIPFNLSWVSSLIPPLVERRINEEGEPIGTDEWMLTRLGGVSWARPAWISSLAPESAINTKLFPHLGHLNLLSVVSMSGSLDFKTPTHLLPGALNSRL